jgi:hypothetical protein
MAFSVSSTVSRHLAKMIANPGVVDLDDLAGALILDQTTLPNFATSSASDRQLYPKLFL